MDARHYKNPPRLPALHVNEDAAPALLNALEELLFRVNRNDVWVNHSNPSEAAMRKGVVKRARAAIALARMEE